MKEAIVVVIHISPGTTDSRKLGKMRESLQELNELGNNGFDNHSLKRLLQALIHAAIYKHCLTGDVRGALGSEPDDGIGHLVGLA